MKKSIEIEGFPVICHGAQTMHYKKKYCELCPLLTRAKYPPCVPSWRISGAMTEGGMCNIKRILKL